jgi:hypothetical protein
MIAKKTNNYISALINAMKQEETLSKTQFENYYGPILKGYSEKFREFISPLIDIGNLIYRHKDLLTKEEIHSIIRSSDDKYLASLLYRILGVREILNSRDRDEKLDIQVVWDLISKSIKIIPNDLTISSIGSQGFLSIPLYKADQSLETFDFIRLHIWDDSLNQYMDLEKCENFSIHSHTFYARSWVITGMVRNDRFEFDDNPTNSSHSFFDVVYNDSLNEVNQHSSKAINNGLNVGLIKTSEEVHFANGCYEIKPSKLHKSGHLNSPHATATFFSFTGKDGLGESFVIGPKDILESEVNRKINISPVSLLEKITNQL